MTATHLAQEAQMSTLADAAARYARHGWPVFPVHTPDGLQCSCGRRDCPSTGKHPRTRQGLGDATDDQATLERWWRQCPTANIGVLTGRATFVVLDVDGDDGADSLHDLEHEYGQLPCTTTITTPRGGQHYYFASPRHEVRTTAGVLAPGLDIRGDRGYVLAPPSIGPSGRRYEVDQRAPLAPMPRWLLARTEPDGCSRQTRTAPDKWLEMLRGGIRQGQRNVELTRLTGHLLATRVDPRLVRELVRSVNHARCKPPLRDGEVARIVESIAARELAKAIARGGK
jgi:hypothetical protein